MYIVCSILSHACSTQKHMSILGCNLYHAFSIKDQFNELQVSLSQDRRILPGYKRLLIDCFVDCLLLYPQSCVKVRSGLAVAGVGFPANADLQLYDRCHRGGCCCCCWGTCSSLVRRRGCSPLPGCDEAVC